MLLISCQKVDAVNHQGISNESNNIASKFMQPKDENGPCSFAFGCVQDFCNMNSNSRMNAGPFQNHISSVILEDVGK